MLNKDFLEIRGLTWKLEIESPLGIMELWDLITQKILWWAKMWWLEKAIYEEVPAIYVKNFLGMMIILQWYPIGVDEGRYFISFQWELILEEKSSAWVKISRYLEELFIKELESNEIKILNVK